MCSSSDRKQWSIGWNKARGPDEEANGWGSQGITKRRIMGRTQCMAAATLSNKVQMERPSDSKIIKKKENRGYAYVTNVSTLWTALSSGETIDGSIASPYVYMLEIAAW
jgi:hypothetical protein